MLSLLSRLTSSLAYRLTIEDQPVQITTWRAEISPGETLLDPRYGYRGSYHAGWNLRLNLEKERLLEWWRH